jgi:ubiquinone/menaquinone biosynthesis C-methylase UbiE
MVALGPRDFPLLVGDAAELPFAAGSFDAVVMAFMLFHLPRPTAGLAEAWRVLRPGGSVGLLTWGTERESRARRQWVEELDAETATRLLLQDSRESVHGRRMVWWLPWPSLGSGGGAGRQPGLPRCRSGG